MSFLPTLGWAWHRVLPEHEHWFIGGVRDDLDREASPQWASAPDECADCDPLSLNAAVLHLPNPISAIQILAIAAVLVAPFFIFVLSNFSRCPVFQPRSILSPALPLLDPPPKVN